MHSKLVVWYNTKCPVCSGGIKWQQKRLVGAAQAGAIEFRDINLEPTALARFGAGIEDVRRRLYGTDAEGCLFVAPTVQLRSGGARRGMHGSLDCWVCLSRAKSLVLGTIDSPAFSTLGIAVKVIGEVAV